MDAAQAEAVLRLRALPYDDYQRTPHWRRLRRAALARAGWHCALSARHRRRLEVHHNTYERLGCERPADLVVLCADCHRRHHRRPGAGRRPPPRRGVQLRLLTPPPHRP